MAINPLKVIPFVVLACTIIFSKASFSGDEGQQNYKPLRQATIELLERYKQSGATQFDNFHDQFMALKYYQFPNIYAPKHGFKFAEKDFNNPRVLAAYKKYWREKDEEYRLDVVKRAEKSGKSMPEIMHEDAVLRGHAKGAYKDRFKQMNSEDKLEEKRKRAAINQGFKSFIKDGYYKYFSSQLKSEKIDMIDICVSLDWQELGLKSTLLNLSAAEAKEYKRTALNGLLSTLAINGYSDQNFKTPSGAGFTCEIRMNVNNIILTQLYENNHVKAIIPATLVLAEPLLFSPL